MVVIKTTKSSISFRNCTYVVSEKPPAPLLYSRDEQVVFILVFDQSAIHCALCMCVCFCTSV